MFMPSSKTEIAQKVVRMVVSANVSAITAKQLDAHTDFDKDSTTNTVVSAAAGWYAGMKLKPYTDAAVVKTRDAIQSRIPRRNKNTEKSQES